MEKPFSCPVIDCNFSFANEDHLTVHKKKHELSLSLTPTANFKNNFIADQTPTPTRFLKAFELEFEEENPFDATFRRANSIGTSSNLSLPESSSLIASLPESEVLNTPSIILPTEPATPVSIPKITAVRGSDNHVATDNSDSLPFTPTDPILADQSFQGSISDDKLQLEHIKQDLSEINKGSLKKDISKNVLQTSVITSVGNSANLKTSAVGVPTAVVVTRPPVNSISTLSNSRVTVVTPQNNQSKIQENTSAIVQPLCVAPVVQLMIRLPDGQTVQLPVVASAPNSQSSHNVSSLAPQVTSTTSNAKMKLREVLTHNQKTSTRKCISRSKNKQHIHILNEESYGLNDSPPLSPTPTLKSVHHGRKRRDQVDDPEEKRQRSLERNRAAATRCREKRKMWITALERKADELAHVNTQLQSEVNQLRNEVSHLKTMLLAHKDCPVTMQQRATQCGTEKETYTTIRIITSASDDVQRVPNNTAISPLNSDFMEMEVSSVQSSSDASLTSDTSELSCRER